jgi:aspartyl-tRNA(Asn)/glutamyl-tRNA(Gln) amidotransferase subunit A
MPTDQPSEGRTTGDVLESPVRALGRAMRDGALSPVELAEAALQRIEALDEQVRAFVTVTRERALNDARQAERDLRAGKDRGPLQGIPLALKDLVATRGIRTTAGSQVLEDYIPDEDADVAERLAVAGTVLLGKSRTHEFAYGTFTPPTANPWDVTRVPGGSSGGSAAALAAGMCVIAIGTDTGGSIRIPAACCGVTGLKPTYGLVSCYGIIPLSWSLDHAGPLARSVEDCAILLDFLVMGGYDKRDPASLSDQPAWPTYAESLYESQPGGKLAVKRGSPPLTHTKIGIPDNAYFKAVDPEVSAAVAAAIKVLEELGAHIETVSLPSSIDALFPAYRGVQMPEATLAHREAGWWPARAADYGPVTRSRLEMGDTISAVEYLQAQRLRRAFAQEMEPIMGRFNALALPTLPILPPRRDQLDQRLTVGGQELEPGPAMLRLTFPFNMTGQPALSLPCGFSASGLPIGLQLAGRHRHEATLLHIGHVYQQATDWHTRHPAL